MGSVVPGIREGRSIFHLLHVVNSTSGKELCSLCGQGRVKVRTSFMRRAMAQSDTGCSTSLGAQAEPSVSPKLLGRSEAIGWETAGSCDLFHRMIIFLYLISYQS